MYITGPASGQLATHAKSSWQSADSQDKSAAAEEGSGLDTMFTQLLVAQLKSQDPLNPMDPTQFVTHSIGQNTTFNGTTVFAAGSSTASDPNTLVGASTVALTDNMASGDSLKIAAGGSSFTYSYTSGDTVQSVINQINASSLGVTASISGGNLKLVDQKGRGNVTVDPTSTAAEFGAFSNPTGSGVGSLSIYLGDGTSAGHSSISVALNQFDSSHINATTNFANNVNLSTSSLLTAAGAQSALTTINAAVAQVAALRGNIGAGINRLQAATNVINDQTQNLTTAEDGIRSADIGQEVANLTKYNILSSTGISALAQANQMQQSVLKLLQ